jgi:hypothetical protein
MFVPHRKHGPPRYVTSIALLTVSFNIFMQQCISDNHNCNSYKIKNVKENAKRKKVREKERNKENILVT